MSLTDAQLTWAFSHYLSHHNGFSCGAYHWTSLSGAIRESSYRYCAGKADIVGGRIKLSFTCGEPCSFVCKSTGKFKEALDQLVLYDKIIEEAKNACP
jgi:hypothetical protein